MVVLVQDPQVESEQRDDNRYKGQPEPGSRAQKRRVHDFEQGFDQAGLRLSD